MRDLLQARGSSHARRTGALVGLLLSSVAGTATSQQREAAVISAPGPRGASAPSALTADSIAAASLAALEAFTLDRSSFGLSASAEAIRDSIVAVARAQIGRRYVLGGQSPQRGFDCSGLVKYVMAALSIDLPRTANQQARVGREVPRDTALLRPGDVLTFGRGKRISHVGIYVGNGRMVHASTKARRVIETSLIRPDGPLIKPWRGARSVVDPSNSASVADGLLSVAGSSSPAASPHSQR